jgi:CHASE3 domain sensor protein
VQSLKSTRHSYVELQAALTSISSGQNTPAKNQLNAFINEVNAQTGKKITSAQATQLIAAANDIINALH